MNGNQPQKDHLQATRARARVSPVRSRMLDLYEEDQERSLAPTTLVEKLTLEGWEVSLPQVAYHLRRLADAQLIPSPCHGG